MVRTLIVCISAAVVFFLFVTGAHAASFTSSYEVTYDFDPNGTAHVSQNIVLTNHTVDRYPANYTLTLKNIQPREVQASDSLAPLKTDVAYDPKEDIARLTVHFNQKAVGVGTRLAWNLEFKAADLAQKNGRVWEIDLPLLNEGGGVESYQVVVKVPPAFGPEHFVKPSEFQKTVDSASGKTIYQFNNLAIQPFNNLSFAFGDFQLYNVELTYHLQNPTSQKALTEIALPPDLYPNQRVYLGSIEPEPNTLKEDSDSNYLAWYELDPGQKLDVLYKGQIRVSSRLPPSTFQVPPSKLEPYLLPAKYWEVNDEKISNLKSQISSSYNLGKDSKQVDWARAIYNYVTTTLTYNQKRITSEVERYGALRALEDPQNAVCMEYTDLLITLLRSAGIAARELDGYAMTQKDPQKPTVTDTLHAWVQFYDPPEADKPDFVGWRSVDPTWGSTTGNDFFSTLDTNHIVFVVKGHDSEYPYPAGAYKVTGQEERDVQVDYATDFADGVMPLRLWWQQRYEFKQLSMVDKIGLWFSSLIHQITQ